MLGKKPSDLSTKELVAYVVKGVRKFWKVLPYIEELQKRFNRLKDGETIAERRTWEEFSNTNLAEHRLAAQYRPELLPYITKERSVTEAFSRDRDSLKISSHDLDPALLPPESTEDASGMGQDPIQHEDGASSSATGNQDNETEDINSVYQALGQDGFAVQKIRGHDPRPGTPAWITRRELLTEFLRSRISPADQAAKRIPLRVLIDSIILEEFYLESLSDEMIFYDYRMDDDNLLPFESDTKGSRWTCSVEALKKRRERLVEAGNEFFKSEVEDTADPVDEFCASNNHVPGGVTVIEDGDFITPCAASGCLNKIRTARPIGGNYVCPQHPRLNATKSVSYVENGNLVPLAAISGRDNVSDSLNANNTPRQPNLIQTRSEKGRATFLHSRRIKRISRGAERGY